MSHSRYRATLCCMKKIQGSRLFPPCAPQSHSNHSRGSRFRKPHARPKKRWNASSMTSAICIRIIPIPTHEILFSHSMDVYLPWRTRHHTDSRLLLPMESSPEYSAMAVHFGLSTHAPDGRARKSFIA